MAVEAEQGTPPKVAPWNDPRYRGWFFQVVTAVALVWFVWYIAGNTIANLEKQNIATGFGFLSTTAGFGVNQTLIDYAETSTYGQAFLVGLLNTLLVAVIGIVLATVLGFIVGVARLSSNWIVARIATVYVEVLRNIPLLLQIFFWYFGVLKQLPHPRDSWIFADSFILNIRGLYAPAPVPGDGFGLVWAALALGLVGAWGFGRWARRRQAETGRALPTGTVATGLIVGLPALAFLAAGMPLTFEYAEASRFNVRGGLRVIPELVALVLALSFYTASFIAEIVRGGILGVSWGQTEAALSLGLRRGRVLRLVVIPQALRIIIPPLTNQYLNLTKNSSLAVAIAYPDLVSVFAGTTLNQTGQAIEILGITMLVYLGLSLGTSLFMNWYNARVALVER